MARCVPASSSKPNRAAKRTAAQHAQMVLLEAQLRPADGADDARIEIGETADVIEHRSAKESWISNRPRPRVCRHAVARGADR